MVCRYELKGGKAIASSKNVSAHFKKTYFIIAFIKTSIVELEQR